MMQFEFQSCCFFAFVFAQNLIFGSGEKDEIVFRNFLDDQALADSGEPLNEDDFKSADELQDSDEAFPNPDPTEQLEYFEGDIIEDVKSRNAIRGEEYLWPEGKVPYVISKNYDKRGRSLIAKAVQEYHNRTCIRFIPRRKETDYIFFNPEGGTYGGYEHSFIYEDFSIEIPRLTSWSCASYVGRIGGGQGVSLGKGCYLTGVFLHELMHALGFMHEQSRHDREEYIAVKWDNVKPGREINFQKHSWDEIQNLGEKYDYGSILHYDQYAFAKDSRKPTIVTKKKNVRIGQRLGFSPVDVRKINKLYKCGGAKRPRQSEESCLDNNESCKVLVRSGMCSKDRRRMVSKCKKSCEFCGQ